jgi:acyl-CoA synthetase (AMP-forming)/AMP-acid ligase II
MTMLYTVPDLLMSGGRQRRQRIAVIDGGTSASYEDLAAGAARYSQMISRLGVLPGDRVALLLPRSIETLAVFFGAQLAGAVTVFISERLRPRQIAQILGDAEAAAIFTIPRLRALLRDSPVAPDRVIDIGGAARESAATARARVIGRDLAVLAYTSGSTGRQKGVMLTHDALMSGAAIVADYLGLSSADRTLALLPWSFDYGLSQVLSTLHAGGTVVVQRSAFPPQLCRTLADAGVTGMAGVPSLWGLLRQRHSPFLKLQFSALRYLTNSGGPLSADLVRDIRQSHPQAALYLMYGLTEAFRSTYLPPDLADTRPASIGKAIPDTEILVVSDDGRPCRAGEMGELVHRGPTAALGYWRDVGATARVFRAHPCPPERPGAPETVVYSGDYVRADAEGYLYYLGRRDELFKSRGTRVNPAEIEAEIVGSGMVAEAAVFSARGHGADPVIVAAVLPADRRSFQLSELADYCRSEMPAHMLPAEIVPMPALPRTPTGKTDRAALRGRLAAAGTLGDDPATEAG